MAIKLDNDTASQLATLNKPKPLSLSQKVLTSKPVDSLFNFFQSPVARPLNAAVGTAGTLPLDLAAEMARPKVEDLTKPKTIEQQLIDFLVNTPGSNSFAKEKIEHKAKIQKMIQDQKLSSAIKNLSTDAKKAILPKDMNFGEQVAGGVGSAIALTPVAALGALLSPAGLNPTLLPSIVSALAESELEGGSARERALEKGISPVGAEKAKQKAFNLNLPMLAGTNALGFIGRMFKEPAKETAEGVLKSAIKSVFPEFAQEGYQSLTGDVAVGDKLDAKKALKEGAVGGIVGGLFGGAAGAENVEATKQEVKDLVKSIKSQAEKVVTSESGQLKFADEKEHFKSNLKAVAQSKLPNAVSAEQAIKTLQNSGLSKEEIEFSGVEKFLKEKGKVTKQELVDFIEKNKVKIKPIIKGYKTEEGFGNEDQEFEGQRSQSDATKYSKYTLPGGENYKETLLTLPETATVEDYDSFLKFLTYKYGKNEYKKWSKDQLTDYEKQHLNDLYQKRHISRSEKYKSSHWDEPNPLVHHRTNQRTDTQGNKGTFVEEIQSDWHREGRSKGYASKLEKSDIEVRWHEPLIPDGHDAKNYPGYWEAYDKKTGNLIIRNPGGKTAQEAIDATFRDWKSSAESGVPNAPFKNTWHELALKDVIRQAVERGDKFVAFISGQQTADRYDLSKQVDKIEYQPGDKMLRVFKDGKTVLSQTMKDEKHLEEYIGKDAAKKILEQPLVESTTRPPTQSLEGQEMQVGGNWAKKFYDDILPKTAEKYIKKWGGKIQDITFAHVRGSVEEGRAMENIKTPILIVTSNKWAHDSYVVFENDQIIGYAIPDEWVDERYRAISEEIDNMNELARGNDEHEDNIPTREQVEEEMENDFFSENSDIDEYRDGYLRCDGDSIYQYDDDGWCKFVGRYDTLDDFFIEQAGEDLIQKGFYLTPQMIKEVKEVGQPLFGNRLAGGLEKLLEERGSAGVESNNELPEDWDSEPLIFKELRKIKETKSDEELAKEWDEKSAAKENTNKKMSIQDQAEAEIEMLSYTNSEHPLEAFMKDHKLKSYKSSKESEEFSKVPKRFIDEKKGIAPDELANMVKEAGFSISSDGDLFQALADLGDKKHKFGFSPEVEQYLKVKANVDKVGKKLSNQKFNVQKVIAASTGLKRKITPSVLFTTEEKFMKWIMKERETASKQGFKEGAKVSKSEKANIITGLKNLYLAKQEKIKRDSELKQLKQDILSRDKSTAEKATLKAKYEERIAKINRENELDQLKTDIEKRNVDNLKKQISDYAIKNLPISSRGKFITRATSAKTFSDLIESFKAIDQESSRLKKIEITEKIKKLADKVESSEGIDIKYKNKILDLIKNVDFTKRRPETLDKIRAIKNFIDSQKSLGKDVFMPGHIIEKLQILSKKPASEISIAELENFYADLNDLIAAGQTKRNASLTYITLKKENILKDLEKDTKKLEDTLLKEKEAGSGEKLSLKEKIYNKIAQTTNMMNHIGRSIMFIDTLFDYLDGGKGTMNGANYRHFKQRIDTAYSAYLSWAFPKKQSAVNMAQDLKLSNASLEKIGMYAINNQTGGTEKLISSGISKKTIDNLKLNAEEMKFYNFISEKFKEVYPELNESMQKMYNRNLGKVKNYFPFYTDYKLLSEAEIEDRFGEYSENYLAAKKKNVDLGRTKQRVGGKNPTMLNALQIYTKYMDDVSYIINMSQDIKMLKEIAGSEKYLELAGREGQSVVIDWIDTLARKGGLAGGNQIEILDTLRRNASVAILGFKLSSMLLQPTAIFDGASYIGHWAFTGLNDVVLDAEKRKFVQDNMPELKARIGDDPAYLDFSSDKLEKTWKEKAMLPMKLLDGITASGVAFGAYTKKLKELNIPLDLKTPNKKAIEYAQRIVRQSQSSGSFKDVPLALSRGKMTGNVSFDKAIFQFQNFMLKRLDTLRWYLYEAKLKGGRFGDKDSRDFKKAFGGLFMVFMSVIAETYVRLGLRSLRDLAFKDKTGQKYYNKIEEDLIINALQTVPFLSHAMSMAMYKSELLASAGGITDVVQSPARIILGKKPETKVKGAIGLLSGLGTLTGVPGTYQIADLFRSAVKGNSEDNARQLYRQYYQEKNPSKKREVLAQANKIARRMGLNAIRLKANAEKYVNKKEKEEDED